MILWWIYVYTCLLYYESSIVLKPISCPGKLGDLPILNFGWWKPPCSSHFIVRNIHLLLRISTHSPADPPGKLLPLQAKGSAEAFSNLDVKGMGGSMGTHEEWEMMRASSCIPMLCWRPNSVADPLCLVNLVKYHFRSFNPRYEHLDPSLGLSPKPVLHSHEHWLYSSAVSRH